MLNTLGVETNQHVQLTYQAAGTFERCLAFVIDGILIIIYAWLVDKIWDFITPSEVSFQSEFSWIQFVIVVIPIMLYHLVIEIIWKGFSVGKKMVGIRVTRKDGSRPELGDYVIRWLFRFFEITFTGGIVAVVSTLVNGKGQRLGDMAAGTSVVKVGSKISLNQTILAELDLHYEPIFQQVIELTDEDVTIIRDVLSARKNYEQSTWIKMLEKTRRLIEKKTGAVAEELDTIDYLVTIIKDYNALHGSI
ncbi:MAG: RDD family protein [Balneola sp.]|nr:MAG: RDD family protein [Balneola sp.]